MKNLRKKHGLWRQDMIPTGLSPGVPQFDTPIGSPRLDPNPVPRIAATPALRKAAATALRIVAPATAKSIQGEPSSWKDFETPIGSPKLTGARISEAEFRPTRIAAVPALRMPASADASKALPDLASTSQRDSKASSDELSSEETLSDNSALATYPATSSHTVHSI